MKLKFVTKNQGILTKGQMLQDSKGNIYLSTCDESGGEIDVVALHDSVDSLKCGDILPCCVASEFSILKDAVILSND